MGEIQYKPFPKPEAIKRFMKTCNSIEEIYRFFYPYITHRCILIKVLQSLKVNYKHISGFSVPVVKKAKAQHSNIKKAKMVGNHNQHRTDGLRKIKVRPSKGRSKFVHDWSYVHGE